MDSSPANEHDARLPKLGGWITALRIGAWVIWIGGGTVPLWLDVPVYCPPGLKALALLAVLFWIFVAGAIPWTLAFALESVERIRGNMAQGLDRHRSFRSADRREGSAC